MVEPSVPESVVDEPEDDDADDTPAFHAPPSGPDREDMVAEYLPDKEDWTAKTVLDLNDPARIAVLRNWGEIFPEVEHHQPVIDDFLDNFLRARTSVAGESRRDYKSIFRAMFGGGPEDQPGGYLAALGAPIYDDD